MRHRGTYDKTIGTDVLTRSTTRPPELPWVNLRPDGGRLRPDGGRRVHFPRVWGGEEWTSCLRTQRVEVAEIYLGQEALPTLLTPGNHSFTETGSGIPGPWQAHRAGRSLSPSLKQLQGC